MFRHADAVYQLIANDCACIFEDPRCVHAPRSDPVLPTLRHFLYMAGSDSGLTATSLRHRLKREPRPRIGTSRPSSVYSMPPSTCTVSPRARYVLRLLRAGQIDLARLAATELPLGFPLRARAELIERDLLALGLSPAEIVALPLCSERPELSCFEDLAGSLYVLEGACLGDRFLPRCCTGARPRQRWRCCVLRRRWGVDAAEVVRRSCLARRTAAYGRINRKDHREPRRRRSMPSRDGRGCSRGIAVVHLNDCDREPIHIPGTIQPFGVLFGLDEEMKVTHVSENVSDLLSLRVDEVLGRPLSETVDPAGAEEVRSVLREQRWHDANPLSIGAGGRRFDGIVHHHEGAAILELEPNPEDSEERSIHHPFRAALLRVQRASTVRELGAIITQEMRQRPDSSASCSIDSTRTAAAPSTPKRGMRRTSRISACTIRRPTSRAGTQAVSQELAAAGLRRRPEASADRFRPATRHGGATRSQLRGASQRLAHSHRVHENMGVRVDERLPHRAGSVMGAHQLFEPHRSATPLAPHAIGMRVHGPACITSDRRVRGPRIGRVARLRRVTEDALHRAMKEAMGSVLASLVAQPRALMDLVDAGRVAVLEDAELVTCGAAPPADVIREIARWLADRAIPGRSPPLHSESTFRRRSRPAKSQVVCSRSRCRTLG